MRVNGDYSPRYIQPSSRLAHNWDMAKRARQRTFLREWRKQQPGRTLEQVAELAGISQPQLGRIERGDSPYNQDILERLAEIYGCSVTDLIRRDPTEPTSIWSLWDRAKPAQRRVIEAAADAIIKSDAA